MADAAPILSAHIISELRKLEGRAKVTYPYGTTTHPRVERVVKLPLSEWQIAFDTPDEQESACLLKQQEKIGEDDHYAHVYRRYEKLPGPVLSSPMINGRGELGTMTTQAVEPGSVVPASGLGVESDSVETQSAVEALQTRSTVTREEFMDRNRNAGVAFGAKLDVVRTRIAASADTSGLAAVAAAGVQDVTIEQLTTGEKEVTTVKLASGETQPTLVEWSRDNRVGFNVKVEKTKVDASVVSSLPGTGPSHTANTLTEYEPFQSSKDFHVKVVSTFPSQSTTKEAQNAYNASYSFVSESKTHPIFERSYILPRIGYEPDTSLAPLTAVTGIDLTAGGTGYTTAPTVTIAGTGTGATAACQVSNGQVISVQITNGGTGYTTAPTVSFVGTGAGATAVASIQPQTAVLIKEAAVPAEGNLGALFLRVDRSYKTLPGPMLSSPIINGRGELGVSTTQAVAPGSVVPASGLGVERDTVEAVSANESTHERTVVTRATFTDRKRDAVAFGAKVDVIRSRIAATADTSGLSAVAAASVQEVQIEHLTTGEKEVTTVRLASGETQPTLVEWTRDNRVGFNVKIEKTKVDASVVSALTASGPVQTANVLTEYVPFQSNKNFHIRIVSTFPTQSTLNGLNRTYPITAQFRFPDLLREAKLMIPYIYSTDLSQFDYDVALRLKVDQGHSGQFNGTVTEYYTYDPEATIGGLASALKQVTPLNPRADLLPAIFWTYSTSSADVGLRNFAIPSTLRNAQTITGVTYQYIGGTLTEVPLTGGNSPSVAIEASSPTLAEFLAMETIVIDIDVQPYVAGIYIVRITKIKNPHFGT